MSLAARIRHFFLPEATDFFADLTRQCISVSKLVEAIPMAIIESAPAGVSGHFEKLSASCQAQRKRHLQLLNKAFVTPVDKEAISRVYVHLNWIVLSVQHLLVEINSYAIVDVGHFKSIFSYINCAMKSLTEAVKHLNKNKSDRVMEEIAKVIEADNDLIQVYATTLSQLFKQSSIELMLEQREVLSQLKEISKRIHICSNQIEDIVYKLN